MKCIPCKIEFTTKQVNDRCPICGGELRSEKMEEENKTWDFQGKTFKKCPGCGKAILAEWRSHLCGWGKQDQPFQPATQAQPPKEVDVLAIMSECLNNAIELTENINIDRAESKSIAIKWTTEDIRAIANSMFIQKFKVLGYK